MEQEQKNNINCVGFSHTIFFEIKLMGSLRRLNTKYKITDKLHNHRLRHTRITRWKEQGVDMNAIQYLAGHVEGSEITDKVYIDVSEEFAFKQLEKAI